MIKKRILFLLLCALFLCVACKKSYIPHPYGYQRIAIPDTAYSQLTGNYPYVFDISANARVIDRSKSDEKYWIDVYYPMFNARLHCSYKQIENNLAALSEESQHFVYRHASIADAIPERGFENTDKRVYGVLYELHGNTASPLQFVLTDSVHHFFRSALYFNCTPNQDSLAPIVQYLHTDIIRMVESFEWK